MKNIFSCLGATFPCEDFFTSVIGLFIERNAEFRDAFLSWLEEACGESLRNYAWRIELQSGSPSCSGEAILDMKLRHPEVELWFEHKVGATLNRYKKADGQTIDQLQKYLDAAARVMCGIASGVDGVEWPEAAPVAGQPRILLFYLSRSGVVPLSETYEGRIHSPGKPGLVWPASGPLRWRDFWPKAKIALEPTLAGEAGEFERTLALQLVNYWQSLPGMWMDVDATSDWQNLVNREEGERAGIEPLLDGVVVLATQTLGWKKSNQYMGNEYYFSLIEDAFDQVTFYVHATRDELPVDSNGLTNEVIQLQFRLREETLELPPPGQQVVFERWRGVTALGKSKGRSFARLYVGVSNWEGTLNHAQRTKAITSAFVASLKMFQQLTGHTLPGVGQL